MAAERCSWCGAAVESEDGYRATEPSGARRATFCRLEHVVPWAIQGPHWEAGETPPAVAALAPDECSHCGAALTETLVLLIRHRGEHRIADAFCTVEHLREWAVAGGRWG
jgi:hypothetical protein